MVKILAINMCTVECIKGAAIMHFSFLLVLYCYLNVYGLVRAHELDMPIQSFMVNTVAWKIALLDLNI